MTPKQDAALRQAREALVVLDQVVLGTRRAEEAIAAIDEALAEQPAPPECQTEAEKTAFAFGWWKALEMHRKPAQQQEPVNKYCCHLCFNKSGQAFLDRMILCPECGNKRCPKATYHELPCTNSNEPGQTGSIYTSPPASKPWVDLTDDEIDDIYHGAGKNDLKRAREVLAAFKEKNT